MCEVMTKRDGRKVVLKLVKNLYSEFDVRVRIWFGVWFTVRFTMAITVHVC